MTVLEGYGMQTNQRSAAFTANSLIQIVCGIYRNASIDGANLASKPYSDASICTSPAHRISAYCFETRLARTKVCAYAPSWLTRYSNLGSRPGATRRSLFYHQLVAIKGLTPLQSITSVVHQAIAWREQLMPVDGFHHLRS
jgi:hypothetical protein